MRIIFDRSAFHGPRYQQVRESGIEALCRGNLVTVLHTGIFLMETLALYGHPGRRAELVDQMEFLKSICNGGIFRDSIDIWEDELIRDHSISTPCLLPPDEEHLIWRRALQGIQQPSWADWSMTAGDRSAHSKKKAAQRQTYSSIRKGLAEKVKQEHRGVSLRSYTYEQHRMGSVDALGRAIVDSQFGLPPVTSALVQDRWSFQKERYPYFSSFVEGLAYAGYYAGIEQNASLDDNSQADIELLTFLNHADVVVSSDTRFFRYAFDAIWRPLGKQLVSPEELPDFLAINTSPGR